MGSPLQFVVHSGSSGYLISNIAVSRNSGSRHTVQAKLQTLITLSSSLSLMCTRTRSFSLCAAWSRSTRYFTASIILRTVSASNTQVLCTARTVQFMEPRTGLFCLMQLPLSRLQYHQLPRTLPSRLRYPRPPRIPPSRLRYPLRHRPQRNHPRARRPLQFQLGARRRRQPVPTLRRIHLPTHLFPLQVHRQATALRLHLQ